MEGVHLWSKPYDVLQGEVLSVMTRASKNGVNLTREIDPITFNNLVAIVLQVWLIWMFCFIAMVVVQTENQLL